MCFPQSWSGRPSLVLLIYQSSFGLNSWPLSKLHLDGQTSATLDVKKLEFFSLWSLVTHVKSVSSQIYQLNLRTVKMVGMSFP